jgi:uncharacterized protein (TIGR00299 family) protein
MRIAYFDCFSGISGDMCLGALVNAGVDFAQLKEELAKLPVEGYNLHWEKVNRNGITAANVFVDLLEIKQPQRRLADILKIIDSSALLEEVKEKSKAVFCRLAVAEAAVHGTTVDQVHFHEVGAVDAIVDIVGTVLGLHLLGAKKVYASPLPMGKGFIKCMHGIMPSPAPATLEVLRDVPIYGTGIEGELVTPTGAALISVLADDFINLPQLTVKMVGYGSGKKNTGKHPNLLRLILGDCYENHHIQARHNHVHEHHHNHGHHHEHDHDHQHNHHHAHHHNNGHNDKQEHEQHDHEQHDHKRAH